MSRYAMCDRCKNSEPLTGNGSLPDRWEKVAIGNVTIAELCGNCLQVLRRDFMNPPQVARGRPMSEQRKPHEREL